MEDDGDNHILYRMRDAFHFNGTSCRQVECAYATAFDV